AVHSSASVTLRRDEEGSCPPRAAIPLALLEKPSEEQPLRRIARDCRDRIDEGDLLRTNFDAVLRLAAIGDAAFAHHGLEALVFVHRPGRVQVVEAHEVQRERADERRGVVVLRTRLEAAAARHAARERVALFLILLRLARAGAELVRA